VGAVPKGGGRVILGTLNSVVAVLLALVVAELWLRVNRADRTAQATFKYAKARCDFLDQDVDKINETLESQEVTKPIIHLNTIINRANAQKKATRQ
jgi:hypothetical protein